MAQLERNDWHKSSDVISCDIEYELCLNSMSDYYKNISPDNIDEISSLIKNIHHDKEINSMFRSLLLDYFSFVVDTLKSASNFYLLRLRNIDVVLDDFKLTEIAFQKSHLLVTEDEIAKISVNDQFLGMINSDLLDSNNFDMILINLVSRKFNDVEKSLNIFTRIMEKFSKNPIIPKRIIEYCRMNNSLPRVLINYLNDNKTHTNNADLIELLNEIEVSEGNIEVFELASNFKLYSGLNQRFLENYVEGCDKTVLISNLVYNDNFKNWKEFNLEEEDLFIAMKNIYIVNPEIFMKFRKLCIKGIVKSKLRYWFEEPFPIVTPDEHQVINSLEVQIECTDFSRINNEQINYLVNLVNRSDEYKIGTIEVLVSELINLDLSKIANIFLLNFHNTVEYSKLSISKLSESVKDEYVKIMLTAIKPTSFKQEVDVMKKIDCISSPMIIKRHEDKTLNNLENLKLILEYLNQFLNIPTEVIKILSSYKIEYPFNQSLTKQLYKYGEYKLYLASKVLNDKAFVWDKKIGDEIYFQVFNDLGVCRNLLLQDNSFMNTFIKKELFLKVSIDILQTLFAYEQTDKLMKHLIKVLTLEQLHGYFDNLSSESLGSYDNQEDITIEFLSSVKTNKDLRLLLRMQSMLTSHNRGRVTKVINKINKNKAN